MSSTVWEDMKLEPWEPDLRTLRDRAREGELDLQPDFQRGRVWPVAKQQKLIDTILRGWAVPAVHLLVLKDHTLAVLDGQQRLNAMIDFLNDKFKVKPFEPRDAALDHLVGRKFSGLPPETQRMIFSYKVSSYRLYEYEPEEPYELFFRLNLPTGLTQAEKRNALVGGARQQVKNLLEIALESGWSKETLGFENSRLAYDDAIAKVCEYVESGSLRIPMNTQVMESRYRSVDGYSDLTVSVVTKIIRHIGKVDARRQYPEAHLNKATLLTWALTLARRELDHELQELDVDDAFFSLEIARANVRTPGNNAIYNFDNWSAYAALYSDRASLRVADVLSVLARDICVWRTVHGQNPDSPHLTDLLSEVLQLEALAGRVSEPDVLHFLESPRNWGSLK